MLLASAALPAQTLVTVDWVNQRRSRADVVILDARPEAEYRAGHIPGAAPVDAYTYHASSTPEGEVALQKKIAEIFSRAGVRPGDQVVIYEDRLGSRAAKAYWMLRYAGHDAAHMLEGGLEAWRARQLPVSTEAPPPRTPVEFRVRPQKHLLASAAELKNSKIVILDVRTRAEFDKGSIPGARWIEWTELLSADRAGFQTAEQLKALLAKHGITPDQEIATYCQSGARSSAAWSALDALGFRKSSNYVGSWLDWSALNPQRRE